MYLSAVTEKLSLEHKHVMMETKGRVMAVLQHANLNPTIDVLDSLQSVKILHHRQHQLQLLLVVEMAR